MMDRQKGLLVFECDSCGETLDTEKRDFDDARAVLKREGWRTTTPDDGETWEHSCPGCK